MGSFQSVLRASDVATVSDHERFRVHFVDDAARLFRFHTSDRKYADACLIADAARVELGGDWVIFDGVTGACVYDSRRLTRRGS